MNFSPKRFIAAFAITTLSVGTLFGGLQLLLMSAGELCQDCVVARQLSGEKRLYSSGLDQSFFHYKIKLMHAVKPQVIVVGSSRSMQVRSSFFKASFTNLGGTVNSVGELEALVDLLAQSESHAELALVFMDPWWFNSSYVTFDTRSSRPLPPTRVISLSLARSALSAMANGNWVAQSAHSQNLGIHAILTGDGFSSDGSYYYTGFVTGGRKNSDAAFADTLARIRKGNLRFERGEHADVALLRRACAAVTSLKKVTRAVVMIAPPFAERVWSEMAQGGYGYIQEANTELAQCVDDVPFYDFSAPSALLDSNDCEFVDGFHGGDVAYARLIGELARAEPKLQRYVSLDFIHDFTAANAGLAQGVDKSRMSGPEVDFLGIGCAKSGSAPQSSLTRSERAGM